MEKNLKVGLFGGSFNPVHNGHLAIAKSALEQYSLDEVWFIPAKIQPFKQNDHVLDSFHRLQMVNLAIKNESRFKSCDIELKKSGISYTCETLELLNSKYPSHKFYFIMGADSIHSFEKWKDPDIICDLADLLIAVRHDTIEYKQLDTDDILLQEKVASLKKKYGDKFHMLKTPYYDVSSTMIRQKCMYGATDSLAVPDAVLSYIKKENLYREEQ